jgi:hypothetical protein
VNRLITPVGDQALQSNIEEPRSRDSTLEVLLQRADLTKDVVDQPIQVRERPVERTIASGESKMPALKKCCRNRWQGRLFH